MVLLFGWPFVLRTAAGRVRWWRDPYGCEGSLLCLSLSPSPYPQHHLPPYGVFLLPDLAQGSINLRLELSSIRHYRNLYLLNVKKYKKHSEQLFQSMLQSTTALSNTSCKKCLIERHEQFYPSLCPHYSQRLHFKTACEHQRS